MSVISISDCNSQCQEQIEVEDEEVFGQDFEIEVGKLTAQLQRGGVHIYKNIGRALQGLLGGLGVTQSACRLATILSNMGKANAIKGEPTEIEVSHLKLLQFYNKKKLPRDPNNEAQRNKAIKYMSNVIADAVKSFEAAGYPDMYSIISGDKTKPTIHNVRIVDVAIHIVADAYSKHDRIKFKAITKTIDDLVTDKLTEIAETKQGEKSMAEEKSIDIAALCREMWGRFMGLYDKFHKGGHEDGIKWLEQAALQAHLTIRNRKTRSLALSENHDLSMLTGGGAAGVSTSGQDTVYPHVFQEGNPTELSENEELAEMLFGNHDFSDDSEEVLAICESENTIQTFRDTHCTEISFSWLNDAAESYDKMLALYEKLVPVDDAFSGIQERIRRQRLPLKMEFQKRHSLTMRPIVEEGYFYVQLDDLDCDQIRLIKPFAFLIFQTTSEAKKPKCYQAWVCIKTSDNESVARRLRDTFHADAGASRSMRIPGSINFKPKYGPEFPRVVLLHTEPGRVCSENELLLAALITPEISKLQPEAKPVTVAAETSADNDRIVWLPSYQKSLENAARKAGGEPDRSDADMKWLNSAAHAGHTDVQFLAGQLFRVSERAREQGLKYALRAAKSAVAYVLREKGAVAA